MWFGPITWLCLAIAAPALADRTVLVNEIGVPSTSSLFIANADGSNEHALLLDANMDYDASFSADGQWIVFTSERRGPEKLFRVHRFMVRVDGSNQLAITDDKWEQDTPASVP